MAKLKLHGRTVRLIHREAEGSLLALQVLLAWAARAVQRGHETVVVVDSPRRVLLRLRGALTAQLRRLGPRQFAQYQRRLEVVRSAERVRHTANRLQRLVGQFRVSKRGA